ncbi:MAG: hypothetical protein AVDCRST_MAG66-2732, partial [uncultured Pseudonocardia sp.]
GLGRIDRAVGRCRRAGCGARGRDSGRSQPPEWADRIARCTLGDRGFPRAAVVRAGAATAGGVRRRGGGQRRLPVRPGAGLSGGDLAAGVHAARADCCPGPGSRRHLRRWGAPVGAGAGTRALAGHRRARAVRRRRAVGSPHHLHPPVQPARPADGRRSGGRHRGRRHAGDLPGHRDADRARGRVPRRRPHRPGRPGSPSAHSVRLSPRGRQDPPDRRARHRL